jgi:hypothetical protein
MKSVTGRIREIAQIEAPLRRVQSHQAEARRGLPRLDLEPAREEVGDGKKDDCGKAHVRPEM